MILAINIGNTNLTLALKTSGRDMNITRHPAHMFNTAAQFSKIITETIPKLEDVSGVVVSSVNPNRTDALNTALVGLFSFAPLNISADISMRLNLNFYNKTQLGSDRIAVCEGAISKYSLPAIVFDFGTATTINVINSDGSFLGGSILPGVVMGAQALATNTAMLPALKLQPQSELPLIGRNTEECILSGVVLGNAAIVDDMTARIEEQLGLRATVILTGGSAHLAAPYCRTKIISDDNLLADGLFELWKKNSD